MNDENEAKSEEVVNEAPAEAVETPVEEAPQAREAEASEENK